MSLKSAVNNPPAPKRPRTKMDVWADNLPADEVEALEKLVRDPEWRHTDLLALMISEGAPAISDTTFGAWRKRRATA